MDTASLAVCVCVFYISFLTLYLTLGQALNDLKVRKKERKKEKTSAGASFWLHPVTRGGGKLVLCRSDHAGKIQILQLQMGVEREAQGGKQILSPPPPNADIPLRFRPEWSQTVARTQPTTHTLGCKQHTITMPSASWQRGNPLWQRITLISSSAGQSQSYQRCCTRSRIPPGFTGPTLLHSSSHLLSSLFVNSPVTSPSSLFLNSSASLPPARLLLRAPLSLATLPLSQ